MQPVNTPKPTVAVEWDSSYQNKRQRKEFGQSHHAARRFFALKLKNGQNPKVKKGA